MSEHPTILFAEDNPHDVELTLSALAQHNLTNEIVAVPDGAVALDYLFRRGRFALRPAGNPALALLDLKMPKLDGLDVLRAIRADPALKQIPVIILTSSREEQDLARSYELGVNAYVLKPVDFQAFVDAVQAVGVFWTIHNQPPPGTMSGKR
ncbi:MAG: two-component system response regulator [Verrucomicrobia bacterium]|nr:two-component system response regulator [Verrucomicrobiota bacterium]